MTGPLADPAHGALLARRAAALGPSYRLFYDTPFHPVRAEGVWMYEADGTAWLDAYNNVPCVGHCHPAVVAALAAQAARLNTHTRYLDEAVIELAERLLATLPAALDRALFTCTGSEANDLALRIAHRHTGGTGIVVSANAYHGGTLAVAAMSPALGAGVGPHVRTVPVPAADANPEALARDFASAIAAGFDALAGSGHAASALVFDPLFSSDGIHPPPPGVMAAGVAEARAAGAVVIADEVQAGHARTGAGFWGFQSDGLIPDIVTMGKPMGAGHPMAGLAVRSDLIDPFGAATRYFNTFGGNPVSARVGLAVLDVIDAEKLQQNAARTGRYLRDGLRRLAAVHRVIAEVRGAGLCLGVELADRGSGAPDAGLAARTVEQMRQRRVLLSATGPNANVLKIRPPLPFSTDHADLLLDALDAALSAARRAP